MGDRQKNVEVEMHLLNETPRAYLASPTGDPRDQVWLPKSQVEFDGNVTFVIPEWLAIEKGLESYT